MLLAKIISPFAVIVLFFLIASRANRIEYQARKKEQKFDLVLVLTYFDKIRAELVVFGIPFLILLVSYFFKGNIWLEDIFQALSTFIVLSIWHKYLFRNEQ
jgi:hypothetical protein